MIDNMSKCYVQILVHTVFSMYDVLKGMFLISSHLKVIYKSSEYIMGHSQKSKLKEK